MEKFNYECRCQSTVFTAMSAKLSLEGPNMPCPSSSYTGDRFRNYRWRNYIRAVDLDVDSYWSPKTLRELVYILHQAEIEGRKVHAVGAGYSFEDLAASSDWMVDLSHLDRVIDGLVGSNVGSSALTSNWKTHQFGDSEEKLIHVEVGSRLYDLCQYMDTGGQNGKLALATMGGALGQHVAGAFSTSTHGSDINFPPLCDLVQAVHLVGVGGQEFWIESKSYPLTDNDQALRQALKDRPEGDRSCDDLIVKRDDDLLESIRVAFGRFGVIYSVVLRVSRPFRLSEYTQALPWSVVANTLRHSEAKDRLGPVAALLKDPPASLEIEGAPDDFRYFDFVMNPRNGANCWIRRRWKTSRGTDLNVGGGSDDVLCHKGIANGLLISVSAGLKAYSTIIGGIPILPDENFFGPTKAIEINTRAAELDIKALDPDLTAGEALAAALNAIWESLVDGVSGNLGDLVESIVHSTITDALAKSETEGRCGRNWHIAAGRADPKGIGDCYRGNSIEVVFGLQDTKFVGFIDEVLRNARHFKNAGYMAVRFSKASRALLSMHNVDHEMACSIEVTSLRGLEDNEVWMKLLEEKAISLGGRPHWGQQNNLTRDHVQRLYPKNRIRRWQSNLLGIVGSSATYSNSYTAKRGLEPAKGIALKTFNGSFVAAIGGGGAGISAFRKFVGREEVFSLIELGDSKIALQASDGRYLGASGGGGTSLDASRSEIGEHEIFTKMRLDDGWIGLRTLSGYYIGASNGGGSGLDAGRQELREFERFRILDLDRRPGFVGLRTQNGHYVGVSNGGGEVLDAGRRQLKEFETFELVYIGERYIALRSYNGRFVGAVGGGGGALDADRIDAGEHETFELIELDGNKIGLRTRTGHFVGTAGGGGGQIDAGRSAMQQHETFTLISTLHLCERSVSLMAKSGHYVGVSSDGTIDADRDALKAHEVFTLIALGGDQVALRAHNGRFVGVAEGGGSTIDANRIKRREHETFTVVHLRGREIALRTQSGHYIGASQGGGGEIDAGRKAIGEFETFALNLL